jgi:hypothetical protein
MGPGVCFKKYDLHKVTIDELKVRPMGMSFWWLVALFSCMHLPWSLKHRNAFL